ncbi:hypothetical protein B0H63DRAFT_539595 [Podospora didyma]|uniref:Uncharacterized protein n=1 Tax=Podospora didyma TaxID=330526 RepID=A0AAE0P098_9PEZI|nr:hypothetical protein B0H63DRAFT_539595 [Podospora didyma]
MAFSSLRSPDELVTFLLNLPPYSDPNAPEYGTPPLAAAQAHIKKSPVGPQIDFVRATGPECLGSSTTTIESFDFAILTHYIWYFSDSTVLHETLFALVASRASGVPHVLTALATNALESFRDANSMRNLRCCLSPPQIIAAAADAGWGLRDEEKAILTPAGERYGWRETTMLLKKQNYEADVEALKEIEKAKSMLLVND